MGVRFFTFFICFSLASCGDIPKPFKSKDGDTMKSLAEPASGYDIRVEPMDGAARPMAMLLANSVADSLAEKEVPATVNALAKSRYVLRGKAEANWGDKMAPFIIVIRWVLLDDQNKTVGEYAQGVRGEWSEWENGDPRIIRSVGQDAAQPFAEMVRKKEELPPPAELRGSGLMVKNVFGAPGDGGSSLTIAIKNALALADVLVTEDKRQADYVLQGEVKVFPAGQSKQLVRVTWTVFTKAGVEVGAAIQENSVPSGGLDGVWGETAAEVAGAAISGIEDILFRASAKANDWRAKEGGKTGKDEGETRKNLTMPPNLLQIPGKAPPPPLM